LSKFHERAAAALEWRSAAFLFEDETGGLELVHLFTFGQDYLAFDSESGALHQLDAVSAAVLEAYIDAGGQTPSAEMLA